MLPPSVEDWLDLYLQHHRRHQPSLRTVAALYAALAVGEQAIGVRQLAARAGADPTTAGRAVRRLRALGVIRISGGEMRHPRGQQAGYREPHRYEAVWPPEGSIAGHE